VVSLGGLAFLSGARASVSVAVTVGGALLVQMALRRTIEGAAVSSSAALAWRHMEPLFRAAGRVSPPPSPQVGLTEPGVRPSTVLDARDIVFRHTRRPTPLLCDLSLRIEARDRILLEGPSGAGKSTLGAILAGLRDPESGLVLVDGLDRRTLGYSAGACPPLLSFTRTTCWGRASRSTC
jgi:ATP-binding cassette subfamily B protein